MYNNKSPKNADDDLTNHILQDLATPQDQASGSGAAPQCSDSDNKMQQECPRRHLDFSPADASSSSIPASASARRGGEQSLEQPQHSFEAAGHTPSHPMHQHQQKMMSSNNDPIRNGGPNPPSSSAESIHHLRTRKSHFSPTALSTSSPLDSIRNSISSRHADMGRRLAQERSKNYELMQQIRELENTVVSLLRQQEGGKQDNVIIDNNHSPGNFEVASDDNSSITILLEQASTLLLLDSEESETTDANTNNARTARSDHPSRNNDENDGLTTSLTQERMHEYHELVTAFHTEQQSHGDIDGEEMISREDILWLFQELKWRYEDILRGYAMDKSREKDDGSNEWRECLEGLVDVVKKSMVPTTPASYHPTSNLHGKIQINSASLGNNTHTLQNNEVSSLNHRLASFAIQHKEICRSLSDDMQAQKRDYQEQLNNKSQCIHNLESKISEQDEYTLQIQTATQTDRQWIQEEKEKLALTKEGTAVRIHYLEGMLRSLQMEVRESKNMTPTQQGNNKKGGSKSKNSGTTPICSDGEKEQGALQSPPVFLRDLTSAMAEQENDAGEWPLQNEIAATASFTSNVIIANEAKYKAEKKAITQADTNTPSCDNNDATTEITTKLLRDQIASLGNSLVDSETRRANMLDDFQRERQKYMLQYKQMSDVLKLLLIDNEER